jgi:subtilisin family serine protease
MAGTFGSRFVRSSARAARSDRTQSTPPVSRAERQGKWKRVCAGAALALIVPLSTAQVAFAATDPSGITTSTTTPASDTTSTTPASTTTSTTTPASDTTSTTTPAPTTTTPAPSTVAPVATPTGPTVTLLVTTKSGLSASAQTTTIATHGGSEVDAIPALHLHMVEVPAADALTALAAYQGDANVTAVSLDNTRTVGSAASDPGYTSQWALPQIGWDQVHGVKDPSGSATLAILDTGVDANTPDLAGRVVGGWSAFGTDPAADANGHGTHVATIAAAKADDGTGIAGVAYSGVKVMPIQVLGADGTGSDADIINGLVYAVDHGADTVLMAFSNPGESAALQDAVNYAWAHGVVVVAAAGNDASATPSYPAGLAKVVGVGSTDQADAVASFSNTSGAVFVTAPGTGIAASDATGTTSISEIGRAHV